MKKIALFGYSGHGFVVAEATLLSGHHLAGYCDISEVTYNPFSLTYLGSEQDNTVLGNLSVIAEAAVIGIGNNAIRRQVFDLLQRQGLAVAVIQHPAARVSAYATIGAGTFIAAGAVINPLAAIGAGVIANTGCIVEHECKIGDFAHIAPGAVLAGNVTVGQNAFIGANAVVKQGIMIGDNVTIGAGSVVLNDIPDNEIWAGNPAKKLQK